MNTNSTLVSALVWVLVGAVLVEAQSHSAGRGQGQGQQGPSVVFGAQGSREILLHRELVTEKAKLVRVVSGDYKFQQEPDKLPFPRTITRIVVTDQYTNGNGGKATLVDGGPGLMHATLHLKSQRGHGYSFTIDVYGQ